MQKMVQIIDIAVNVTDQMFRGAYHGKRVHGEDFKLMIDRAHQVGVTGILATGTSLKSSRQCIEVCKQYSNMFCTVGVHPTESQTFLKDPDGHLHQLKQLIQQNPNQVIAVGECGLDYDRLQFCPKDIQYKFFLKQLELALEVKLPLFLHNRNTGDDFVNVMRQYGRGLTGVVHSFTGTMEEMKVLTQELGLSIGVNGCSMKTEENLEVVRQIPVDKLIVETDAPWCEIKQSHASYQFIDKELLPFRSVKKERFTEGAMVKGRNEPCQAVEVLYVLSKLKGIAYEELAGIVFQNTCRMFPAFAVKQTTVSLSDKDFPSL
ncbi:hypothetical protein MIR68_009909 [Amoeboaphelidium protococcarum]|nr:hypothetical protein MIR68_009909 [Amoeboaphelidium protococcarum]